MRVGNAGREQAQEKSEGCTILPGFRADRRLVFLVLLWLAEIDAQEECCSMICERIPQQPECVSKNPNIDCPELQSVESCSCQWQFEVDLCIATFGSPKINGGGSQQVLVIATPIVLIFGCCILCGSWLKIMRRGNEEEEEEETGDNQNKSFQQQTIMTLSSSMTDQDGMRSHSTTSVRADSPIVRADSPQRQSSHTTEDVEAWSTDITIVDTIRRTSSVELKVDSSLRFTIPQVSKSQSAEYSGLMAVPFEEAALEDLEPDKSVWEMAKKGSSGSLRQIELKGTHKCRPTSSAETETSSSNPTLQNEEADTAEPTVRADPGRSMLEVEEALKRGRAPMMEAEDTTVATPMGRAKLPPRRGAKGTPKRTPKARRSSSFDSTGTADPPQSPLNASVMPEVELADGKHFVVNRRGSAICVI